MKKNWEVRAVSRLCELYPGICLTTEEEARQNLNYGSRKVPRYPVVSSTVHLWLTPGGSSTVHIYTQTVHRIQRTERTLKILGSAGGAPPLRVIP
jgi:hypothetical protein